MMWRPAVFLLLVALSAHGAWPTYRHDNRRSGATEEALAFPLKPAWKHEGGTPRQAWSGPAKWDAYSGNKGLQSMRNFDPCHFVTVTDGLVYYGSSHDNAVHALDVQTGTERWVYFTEAPVRLPPTIAGGRAFAGSDDGRLYALDAESGKLLWKDRGAPEDRRIPSNASLLSLWPVRTGALLSGDQLIYAASARPMGKQLAHRARPRHRQASLRGGDLGSHLARRTSCHRRFGHRAAGPLVSPSLRRQDRQAGWEDRTRRRSLLSRHRGRPASGRTARPEGEKTSSFASPTRPGNKSPPSMTPTAPSSPAGSPTCTHVGS